VTRKDSGVERSLAGVSDERSAMISRCMARLPFRTSTENWNHQCTAEENRISLHFPLQIPCCSNSCGSSNFSAQFFSTDTFRFNCRVVDRVVFVDHA